MNVKIYKYGQVGASMIYPDIERMVETEHGILKLHRENEHPYKIYVDQIREMDIEF